MGAETVHETGQEDSMVDDDADRRWMNEEILYVLDI